MCKTIQIAPNREDCKIEGQKVIGKFDGRTLVFEIPAKYNIPEGIKETMIHNFREAIALCSKPWQIEWCLNQHWNIEGGKFYELKEKAEVVL